MNTLGEQDLLTIWEQGHGRSAIEQALLLLSVAHRITDTSKVAKWSIGYRDTQLFLLRVQLFGDVFVNHINCPNCNEKLEWEMKLTDFPLPADPVSELALHTFDHGDYRIQFQMPSTLDVAKADPEKILQACIKTIEKQGEELNLADLPSDGLEALGKEMERLEPIANLSFSLNCAACGHEWNSHFDIISYLWSEIENWAQHLLQEIVALARAFGWTEEQILRLSSRRRQLYLQMIQ